MERIRWVAASLAAGLVAGLAVLFVSTLAGAHAREVPCPAVEASDAAAELSADLEAAQPPDPPHHRYRARWSGIVTDDTYILQQQAAFEVTFDMLDEPNLRGEYVIRNVRAVIELGEGTLASFERSRVSIRAGYESEAAAQGWARPAASAKRGNIWLELTPIDIKGQDGTALENVGSTFIFHVALDCIQSYESSVMTVPRWSDCRLGSFTPGFHLNAVDLQPEHYIRNADPLRRVELESLPADFQ